ncbi:MAG: WD40 repeat domain-containing protein [Ruminococcaceae bacterium]|nr:WD40 repeat domain-containing protein [Oscillospiraceae bacterium]
MKKLISIALLLAMIFSTFTACRGEEPADEQSSKPEAESQQTESEESSKLENSEDISSAEESSEDESEDNVPLNAEGFFELCGQPYINVGTEMPECFSPTDKAHLYSLSLPLPDVEGMSTHISGDNLLINYWDEEDKGVIYSLKTLEVLAEIDMPYWFSVGATDDSGFWVVDKSTASVKLYDKDGKESTAYEGREGDPQSMAISTAYVSPDGRFMFYCTEDNDATVIDLEDGSEKKIELGVDMGVWNIGYSNNCFVLSFFDDHFLLYNPYNDSAESYVSDNVCTVNDGVLDCSDMGFLLLCSFKDERKMFMELEKSEYMQGIYGGYLAVGNSYNTGTVKFYDLVQGKHISTINFGDEIYGIGIFFRDNGTVFITVSSNGSNEFYVYDMISAAKNADEDINILICTDEDIERITAETAEEIYKSTSVELIYGSKGNDFIVSDYVAQPKTNPYAVYTAVNTVKNTLALFPEGMIKEAWEGGYNGLLMYLCGTIYGTGGDSLGEAGAFVSAEGGYLVMVMDITEDLATNIPHELSHVFDRRIEDASIENALDWLWQWENIAPAEDAYTFMYADYESNMRYTIYGEDNPDRVWFIDGYSRVAPTEDRARIMEYLFIRKNGELDEVFEYENIKNKAILYSYILRECFPSCNTDAPLYWEKGLGTIDESVLERLSK